MITEKQYQLASRRTGVPVALLKIVTGQESGGRHNAVSPKGARGEMQLMPGTARGLERRYHINTRTPFGNLLGGAYYLAEQIKHFGSIRLGLAAYNAGPGAVEQYDGIPPYHETQNYVSSIMAKYRKYGGASTATRARANTTGTGIPSSIGVDTAALANQTLQDIAGGQYDPVAHLEALHQQMLASSQQAGVSYQQAGKSVANTGDWHKYVLLAKGADRQGVKTQPGVLEFVGSLGMRLNRKLVIETGTHHNRFVKGTQRESAHWEGHAADIPATGKTLTRLGRQALILAGMDPEEARKAKGGIYNIGHWQIIFNTNEGGNHWNHVHVGYRGGK